MREDGARLLERDHERERLLDGLRAASAGDGRMLLVEGEPGIGKTALLDAAAADAVAIGFRVLRATGDLIERPLPFGVARQLFESTLAAASEDERAAWLVGPSRRVAGLVDPTSAAHAPEEELAACHGLAWLCGRLAVDRPLLLVVDDAQWADEGSLRFLGYLARRLEPFAACLLLGARSAWRTDDAASLVALRDHEPAVRLAPAPLTVAAVAALAGDELGGSVAPAFADACHAATTGNPFTTRALLRELRDRGITGTSEAAGRIDGTAPAAVVRSVVARIDRAGPVARAVADATAVLQPHAELRHVAALSGRTLDEVAAAADALVTAAVLGTSTPCVYAHPILRTAVARRRTEAVRAQAHGRAARLLRADGAPAVVVAGHLLEATPEGDPQTVAVLREAADDALARAAPGTAVTYLERALAEPPTTEVRADLLLALGAAEALVGRPTAVAHLRRALDEAVGPDERGRAALVLAQAIGQTGDLDGAYVVVRDAARARGAAEDGLSLRLHAAAVTASITVGRWSSGRLPVPAADDRSSDAAGLLAALAFRDLLTGAPAGRIRARARAALIDGRLPNSQDGAGGEAAGLALLWIDDLDDGERLFGSALEEARDAGSLQAVAYFSALRAYGRYRAGDLRGAEADLDQATAAGGEGFSFWRVLALITRTRLIADRGDPGRAIAEATAALELVLPPIRMTPTVLFLNASLGYALRVGGREAEACDVLEHVGRGFAAAQLDVCAPAAWRSDLALARYAVGRPDARDPALEELEAARAGGFPRTEGSALHALGVITGGAEGLELLEQSVAVLERCPAPIELAETLHDLGAALRRVNRRTDAREPLRRGLEIAHRCGARGLHDRILAELHVAGARPRRPTRTGADALTPAERRVCELAAAGHSNREIAQALFVTRKTVETHLARAFRKLDVRRRTGLAAVLAVGDG